MRQARPRAVTEKTKLLPEAEKLLTLWRSEGRSPAEVVALFRSHVERRLLTVVGGWAGFERELERRRRRAAPLNSGKAIWKRAKTKRPQILAQRRDPATGRFSKV